MSTSGGRFYGKYRATVTDTTDPLQIGRVKASVADLGETGWAMPCAPVAGSGMGVFALPPTGAGVWIEFEHGDPDYPVWSGCWWGSAADMPTDVLTPPQTGKILLQTSGGTTILLDDTPGTGGITLKTPGGQKIVVSATAIEIDNGTGAAIKLSGVQVSVNNGALEVM